jgi:exportin-1
MQVMSENISAAILHNGENVTKQPLIKSMRVVKKETLKLISGWVSRSEDPTLIMESFLPPLLEAVLLDYQVIFLCIYLSNQFHKFSNTNRTR